MLRVLQKSLFIILAAPAFAQLDSNSVTITASNTANLLPDQIVFSISVNSDAGSTLNDVLTALQPVGVTIANLSGVGSLGSTAASGLAWSFSWAAPLAQMKSAVATLTALAQSIPQANPHLALSFSISGTQISQQLVQSHQCSYADLLQSARLQAQAMAIAGGRTLSGVLALSSDTSANSALSSSAAIYNQSGQSCSLTVKFALLGL